MSGQQVARQNSLEYCMHFSEFSFEARIIKEACWSIVVSVPACNVSVPGSNLGPGPPHSEKGRQITLYI